MNRQLIIVFQKSLYYRALPESCKVEDGFSSLIKKLQVIKKLQESRIENDLTYQSNNLNIWSFRLYPRNKESHYCKLKKFFTSPNPFQNHEQKFSVVYIFIFKDFLQK